MFTFTIVDNNGYTGCTQRRSRACNKNNIIGTSSFGDIISRLVRTCARVLLYFSRLVSLVHKKVRNQSLVTHHVQAFVVATGELMDHIVQPFYGYVPQTKGHFPAMEISESSYMGRTYNPIH
jgi:hypothetical protein